MGPYTIVRHSDGGSMEARSSIRRRQFAALAFALIAAFSTDVGRGSSRGHYLHSGGDLWPDQYIQSLDGSQVLYYQLDGNLVVYQNGSPIWASNTVTSNPGWTSMQGDGNLVVYNGAGNPQWSSGTYLYSGAELHFSQYGGVMLCRPPQSRPWTSNGYGVCYSDSGETQSESPVEIDPDVTGENTCSLSSGSSVTAERCASCGCSVGYEQTGQGVYFPRTCSC